MVEVVVVVCACLRGSWCMSSNLVKVKQTCSVTLFGECANNQIARELPVVLGDAALARLGAALWSEVESSAWRNIAVPSSWGRLPRSMQIYCLREQEYDDHLGGRYTWLAESI